MENKKLEIKTQIQIQKSPSEIFEAIVDPAQMSHYFISSGSARMEEGQKIKWRFPEFDLDISIRVGKMEQDTYISYYWDVEGVELLVEITLVQRKDYSTLVTVTEKSRDNDEAGINWLRGNTEGWANFLVCLKAYLEYGINLRRDAFDFIRDRD